MANNFEIKKPQSFNKTVRLPETLLQRLETLAASKDVSFNQVVIQCCEYALANLPSDHEYTKPNLPAKLGEQ